jgi:hypothetical protein
MKWRKKDKAEEEYKINLLFYGTSMSAVHLFCYSENHQTTQIYFCSADTDMIYPFKSTVVTIRTTSLKTLHCAYSVFMSFILFSDFKAIIYLNGINQSLFVTDAVCPVRWEINF